MSSTTTPVLAGLAIGIGFVVLFSTLISLPRNEPLMTEGQAIEIAKAEVAKNRWFFNFPEGTSVSVLDFNETNYCPESQFLQEARPLPLVLLFQNGTVKDLDGELTFMLSMCGNPDFWYCEFVQSLHSNTSLDNRETLAYFVQLYWSNDNQDHTELFIVNANNGRMIGATIYQTPVLELDDVKRELQALGKVKLTSEQALSIVMDDLDARNVKVDNLHVQYDRLERHISVEEFYSKDYSLPLAFVHESGDIIFVNDGRPMQGYYCNIPNVAYCTFLSPHNLDLRNRLVYGVDLAWNQGTGFYTVDAISGEIVYSPYLKSEALRKT